MRLTRLSPEGFGRLRQVELRLKPGLNLIFGSNESGKSTLRKFIEGMLYGFKKPHRRRRAYTDDLERYRPWAGTAYGGVLEYWHGERHYLVERSFDPDQTIIRDGATGEELHHLFTLDPHLREYDFGRQHLGLGAAGFANTICLGQMALAPGPELADEIRERLVAAASGSREETTVRQALAALDRALAELGTPRAPTRPRGSAAQRLQELTAESQRVAAALATTRELAARLAAARTALAAARDQAAACSARLQELEAREAARRASVVSALLSQRRELEEQLAALADCAGFPADRRAAVERLETQLAALAQRLAALTAELEQLRRQIAEGEARLMENPAFYHLEDDFALLLREELNSVERLEQEVERLTGAADLTTRRMAEVAFQLVQLEAAAAGAPDPLDEMAGIESELRGLERSSRWAEESELARERRLHQGRVRHSATLAWLSLLFGAALGWLGMEGHRLFLVGAALAGALFLAFFLRLAGMARQGAVLAARQQELARQAAAGEERRRGLEEERARLLGLWGASTPRELRETHYRYRALLTERQRLGLEQRAIERELKKNSEELTRHAQKLTAILAGAGYAPCAEYPRRQQVQRLLADLAVYRRQAGELDNLGEQATQLLRLIGQLEGEEKGYRQELAAILELAGVDTPEAFRAMGQRWDQRQELSRQLAETERLLEQATDGRPPGELLARASPAEPGPAVDPEELDEARRAIAAAGERVRECTAETAALQRELETRLEGLPDPGEVFEERQAAADRLAELDQEYGALELARATITRLAEEKQREISPALSQGISSLAARLTGGRYQTVRLAPDLSLTVTAPETGRTVPLSALSGGTIDLLYLAARVAIADAVTGQSDTPLILDDSLVQLDEARLERALTYLGELARDRQIVLLTCHERERRSLEQLGVEHWVVELGH